jgi:hypothetical protein
MRNKKKMQEAMDRIVRLNESIKNQEAKRLNAYTDYYLALGIPASQIKTLIK